jgi:hypothetical protein
LGASEGSLPREHRNEVPLRPNPRSVELGSTPAREQEDNCLPAAGFPITKLPCPKGPEVNINSQVMKKLITICLITVVSCLGICALEAADHKLNAAEKDTEKKAGPKRIPFHGKIDGIDKVAKTIKVGERTFVATAETKFTKAGKPAAFDDAKVGEEVGGAYSETTTGKLSLMSLRIGQKPAEKK